MSVSASAELEERVHPLFYFSAAALALSLLIGGGAPPESLAPSILQLLCLPTLLIALARLGSSGPSLPKRARQALWLLATGVFFVLLQLAPLPPAIWQSFPAREKLVSALSAVQLAGLWEPLSVAPHETWRSLLTLIPAAAVFLSAVQLTRRERRGLVYLALAFGVVNAVLGLLQLANGPESLLYFYASTNSEDAVGLFSNRNHLAALLYALLPFSVAWLSAEAAGVLGDWRAAQSAAKGQELRLARLISVAGAALLALTLIVAEIMTRSRSGVAILMLALLACAFLPRWRDFGGAQAGRGFSRLLGALVIAALLFGLQFGLFRLLGRFELDPLEDARVTFGRVTGAGALAALPTGVGLGSFVQYYFTLERPRDIYPNLYANHAHNDWLEFILEMGAPGILLLGLFLGWLYFAARDAWRAKAPTTDGDVAGTYFARAASVTLALLCLHELADYPLRTEAMMGIFALSCALLVSQPALRREGDGTDDEARRQEPQAF